MRHGPAEARDALRWPDDAARPLTERGVERTRAAASGLKHVVPDRVIILTSPYARALRTAEILRDTVDSATVETIDSLVPGGARRGVLTVLTRLATRPGVILVGHEPDLGSLAGGLIGSPPLAFKKAGACAIEFDGTPREGAGQLLWFLPPRVLRRLSGKESAQG